MEILPLLTDHPTQTFQANETIIEEGSQPGSVLVLKSGHVKVTLGGKEIHTLDIPGTVFGEISVMLNREATATVTAVDECVFYVIDEFMAFIKNKPELINALNKGISERLLNTGHQSLSTLPVSLQSEGCKVRKFKKGDTIIKEGNEPAEIFVLKEGIITILSGQAELARVSDPGTTFGQISAFCGQPYSSTVIAHSDAELFVIEEVAEFFNSPSSFQITCFLAHRLNEVIDQFMAFRTEVMESQGAKYVEPTVLSKLYKRFDKFLASDVYFTGENKDLLIQKSS